MIESIVKFALLEEINRLSGFNCFHFAENEIENRVKMLEVTQAKGGSYA